MENVPEVVGQGNIEHFKKWEEQLRKFGYSNYVEILNAKDYGIPQNRKRCFMVSILGDYSYDFPCKVKLKYRLKDLLEKEVDEKYYLDEETIERISNWQSYQNPLEEAIDVERERERVMPTITTRVAESQDGGMSASMKLIKETFPNQVDRIGNYSPSGYNASSIVNTNGIAPTVMENHGTITAIPIKNATEQGYLFAENGDGVDISSRMEHHRGNVQKGSCQTLTCQGGDNVGVVVDEQEISETDMEREK